MANIKTKKTTKSIKPSVKKPKAVSIERKKTKAAKITPKKKEIKKKKSSSLVPIITISAIIAAAVLAVVFIGLKDDENDRKNEKVFEGVLDVGTYRKLDYNSANEFNAGLYDNWGGCTAVVTNVSGNTIVGRNMDLYISDKSAYIFKTDIRGKYKTLNLAYTHRDYAPDFSDALENGLSDDFYNLLPFISDDVLNEKGLYIEVNMRYGEGDKFSCSGTNPDAKERVYMFSLPIYIGLNAANVDEALEYVKTLDIYSKEGYWNYAFMLADASGRYGVLEFAQNKIFWNEGQNAQTNFYIADEMYEINELKAGVGRYDYVREHIGEVKDKDDMFNLMNDIKYSQVYESNPNFDVRSEYIGTFDHWTYDYLMNPDNEEEFNEYVADVRKFSDSLDRDARKELVKSGLFEVWESSFTEVIDLKEKNIRVRFFEDDNKIYTLSF